MQSSARKAGYLLAAPASAYNHSANAVWLIRNGADEERVIKRTPVAAILRFIWAIWFYPWMFVFWFAGWTLFATLPSLYAMSVGLTQPENGNWVNSSGHWWYVPAALLGMAASFGLVYLGFLALAHIWRWESSVVPGYNNGKVWWKLYKRPIYTDAFAPVKYSAHWWAHQYHRALKAVFFWFPLGAVAAVHIFLFLYSLIGTAIHNV